MGERYEIKGRIGQGGVGAVYEAFDTLLNRSVAIKRLLSEEESEVAEGGLGTDLSKEAAILSSLHHPNIITLYDIAYDEEGTFVVMELIDGETIEDVVQRGAMTEEDFGVVVEQCLEALVAAQDVNLLHRDLKPTNIMVQWLGAGGFQLKILDFGLAKYSSAPAVQTVDHGGAILGSIYFLAPEQFERTPLDRRTDIYALGCVFYYCLTKEYPFEGESAPDVMMAHLEHKIKPLEDIRPDLSPALRGWVMRLMSREMKDRPDSAQQALDEYRMVIANPDMDFEAAVGGPGTVAAEEREVSEETGPVGSKSGRLIMGPNAPSREQVRKSLTSRSVQTAAGGRGDTTSFQRPPLVASGARSQTSRTVGPLVASRTRSQTSRTVPPLVATGSVEGDDRRRWKAPLVWGIVGVGVVAGVILTYYLMGGGGGGGGGDDGGSGTLLTAEGIPKTGLVAHYTAWDGVMKAEGQEAEAGDKVWGWASRAAADGTPVMRAPGGVEGPTWESYNAGKIGELAGPTPGVRFEAGQGLTAQVGTPGAAENWEAGMTFCAVVRSADKANPRVLYFLSGGVKGATAELVFKETAYSGGVRMAEGGDPGFSNATVNKNGLSILTAVWDRKAPSQRLYAYLPEGKHSPLQTVRRAGGPTYFDQWVIGSRGGGKETLYAGDFFELIIYNRPLEEQEVSVLEERLAKRYYAKPEPVEAKPEPAG